MFAPGLGCIVNEKATIQMQDDAIPRCYRPRPLPYALRGHVGAELDRLVAEGIIKPVESAEWASPLVVVDKKDGSIRLCTDFKVTINPHVIIDQYPIPNPTDLFMSLAGGKIFSKIDLSRPMRSCHWTRPVSTYAQSAPTRDCLRSCGFLLVCHRHPAPGNVPLIILSRIYQEW